MTTRGAALKLVGGRKSPVPSARVSRRPLPLFERVVLDVLSNDFGLELGRTMLDVVLARAGEPSDHQDPKRIGEYLRGPFAEAIVAQLGPETGMRIVHRSESLLAGLRPCRILKSVPKHRGPWVLLSARKSAFEGVLEMTRVESILDLLVEVESSPRAIVVVDAMYLPVHLVTLGVVLDELGEHVEIVVVGATREEEETLRLVARRAVSFTSVYEPLGIERRAQRHTDRRPRPIEGSRSSRPSARRPAVGRHV
jgi:hypothetical protein